jgi:hypothetical protein
MKMLCYIVFAAFASQFGLLSAQETKEQTYKSLSGEFVIRKVIKDTEKAKELYPATSPFRGKMCVVKVEFIGDAPKWFGLQPRWVQSLECSGRIEVGNTSEEVCATIQNLAFTSVVLAQFRSIYILPHSERNLN